MTSQFSTGESFNNRTCILPGDSCATATTDKVLIDTQVVGDLTVVFDLWTMPGTNCHRLGSPRNKWRLPCRAFTRECSWILYLRKEGKERRIRQRKYLSGDIRPAKVSSISLEFCYWEGCLELSRLGTKGLGLYKESPCLPLNWWLSAVILTKGAWSWVRQLYSAEAVPEGASSHGLP